MYCYSAARYCPVKDGYVRTCILATAREGVWHLQDSDFDSSDKEIQEKVAADLQPEHDKRICPC